MTRRIALFDVDCLELNEAGDGLGLRPRVAPLAGQVGRLHARAEARGHPLVFTTCCSGRMVGPGDLPGILHVPLSPEDQAWAGCVDDYRVFYLRKNAYGDPKRNYACRAFDMFADNGNAARLVYALDVEEWVVFGNGFDLCVNAAASGLLSLGQRVRLLADVTVPAAKGYGRCGTEANRRRILDELGGRGAEISTLADILEPAPA